MIAIEFSDSTTVRYRVREKLAGKAFNSDAIGETKAIQGSVNFNPDGTLADTDPGRRHDIPPEQRRPA